MINNYKICYSCLCVFLNGKIIKNEDIPKQIDKDKLDDIICDDCGRYKKWEIETYGRD